MDAIVLQRFLSKIKKNENGCWVWQASVRRARDGYGQFAISRKNYTAHRVAYEHFVAPIPNGKVLDHICRNRRCVNPDHLEPVTVKVNNGRGLAVNGTWNQGEKSVLAKLTEDEVRMIRLDQRTHVEIAISYNVRRQTIGDIKNRRRWRHVI